MAKKSDNENFRKPELLQVPHQETVKSLVAKHLTGVEEVAFCNLQTVGSHVKKIEKIVKIQQETQGLGALLDKMEDNDHIKLDNIEIQMYISL